MRGVGRRSGWVRAALACGLVTLAPCALARAFCGFYVSGADARLYNRATVVVLMREGTRTVLSMQNDYQGPPQDFAMVVPVPVVLQREQVRTLPRDVFERIDAMAAPRLVEYWEQDPCQGPIGLGMLGTIGRGAGGGSGSGYGRGAGDFGVRVEARFEVGEYDIVILSARDSSGLEGWLRAERYNIPEGAAEVLRPYVQAGTKFFVAKVDVARVRYENGHAALSPLRVHYDSDTFSLPIRLGLLNSSGAQDLLVHVLASERYEVANRPNVTIPTNLDVADDVRDRFGAFYAALLDRTLARNPGAAVTEYAWNAGTCDPCPGPPLDATVFATLGEDVLHGTPPATGGTPGPAAPPRTPSPPTVRLVPPTVGPAYSPEIVRRIIRRNLNQVRFCIESRAPRVAAQRHVMTLGLSIDAEGHVARATVTASTVGVPAADRCIEQAARRWVFPTPPGGGRLEIRYPLAIDPGATRFGPRRSSFVLTRMHLRYGRDDVGDDLVLRAAQPITGGREVRDGDGVLEHGATPAAVDNFQGRYVIRHPWTGPITCANPVRGIWGGRPGGDPGAGTGLGRGSGAGTGETVAATGLGLVERRQVDLGALLRQSVPELGITVADAIAAPARAGAQPTATPASSPTTEPPAHATTPQRTTTEAQRRVHPVGCSAASSSGTGSDGAPWSSLAAALALAARWLSRRRRRPAATA